MQAFLVDFLSCKVIEVDSVRFYWFLFWISGSTTWSASTKKLY